MDPVSLSKIGTDLLASLGSKGKNGNPLACLRNAGSHFAVTYCSGFSRNSRDPSEAIEQRPQHKRASAQASAEACRAKQSTSGFSRNSRVSSEAIDRRLQYKRDSAQALAEAYREAIEQRLQQKKSSFIRSNRAAGSKTRRYQWHRPSVGY